MVIYEPRVVPRRNANTSAEMMGCVDLPFKSSSSVRDVVLRCLLGVVFSTDPVHIRQYATAIVIAGWIWRGLESVGLRIDMSINGRLQKNGGLGQ